MGKTKTAVSNASFAYSINLLRMLRKMELITEDEYRKIVSISAEYYDSSLLCLN